MLIEELVLRNFGVFKGNQSINLTPIRSESPVILIGGLNGEGKTTLLDALQLALYGKRARFAKRGSQSYEKYLERSINQSVLPEDEAAVELQFRQRIDGEEKVIRICRSWRRVNGRTPESLTVAVNGHLDRVITDTWDQVVEDIIPASISHLFFFDGEKIEALAESSQSKRILSKAIRSLLGLDTISQLELDLSVFESKQRIKGKSSADRSKLEAIKVEITAIENARRNSGDERARLQTYVIDRLEIRLEQLREDYKLQGGVLLENREAIEAEQLEISNRIHTLQHTLIELAGTSLPLLLVKSNLTKIAIQAERESKGIQNSTVLSILEERDHNLLKRAIAYNALKDLVEHLEKYLQEDRVNRARSIEATKHYLTLGSTGTAQVKILLDESSNGISLKTTQTLDEINNLQHRLVELDRKMISMPDVDSISPMRGQITDLEKQLENARIELAALNLEETRLSTKKTDLERIWNREAQLSHDQELDDEDNKRILKYSLKVRRAIEQLSDKMLVKQTGRIAELILESYQILLRKSSLVSALTITPSDFSLELRGNGEEFVDPESLSAGERQLLAVAILWGLARASKRPLPAVIDTPLGRLDAEHRLNLVHRYFPFASHQVLLLSTDTEIDEGLYRELEPHISRTYTLRYSDSENSTVVTPGYFSIRPDSEINKDSSVGQFISA